MVITRSLSFRIFGVNSFFPIKVKNCSASLNIRIKRKVLSVVGLEVILFMVVKNQAKIMS